MVQWIRMDANVLWLAAILGVGLIFVLTMAGKSKVADTVGYGLLAAFTLIWVSMILLRACE